MEKSKTISLLTKRLDDLEKWREEAKKGKKKPQVDEEVCPECGADLLFVEEGMVYCSKCKEYYEHEEEKEE